MIVTIDGPSGTGKSTVARKVAEALGFTYFDTGAMYRSVTWGLLNQNIPLKDPKSIQKYLDEFTFDIRLQDGEKHYFVGEENVTESIRSQKVTQAVSEVSAMPRVRKSLWAIQKQYAEKQSSVFEGRDLGSVVFPNAECKIFLTASARVRAKRRLEELRSKRPDEAAQFDLTEMEAELKRRDSYDSSREIAPLRCPEDAVIIDTSDLSIEQVVEKILTVCRKYVRSLLPSWLKAKNMRLIYRAVLFFVWIPFRLLYRHKVYGLEHFTRRSAIIAPNHASFFDPPLTAISWPAEVHFLARQTLFKPFIFGPFIRALNSHPVSGDVGDVSVFKTILHLLKEQRQIILFPEGARSKGELTKIKPGIGMLLMRSKAAIIPTYLHGTHKAWGRGKKFPRLRGKTACVFGRPIFWESFSHLDKREAQIAIAEELRKAIVHLKKWYESGAKGTP